MSHIDNLVRNDICDGCPVAIALGFRKQKLDANPVESSDAVRYGMQTAEVQLVADTLNIAAGKLACKETEKKLPETPDPMPAVGSQELIEYVSSCPSFPEYLRLRSG